MPRIEDHRIWNAVTVWYMRRALSPDPTSPTCAFKTHPLLLPLHEESDVLLDYTVLRVALPLKIEDLRGEVAKLLEPLARLCERYAGQIQAGEWKYEFYYLELLDRDGICRPLCWISTELLDRYLASSDENGENSQPSQYPPVMAYMDTIASTSPQTEQDSIERANWRQWLVETWQKHEQEWLDKGLLTYDPVRPWSQMLEFVPELADADPGAEAIDSSSLQRAKANLTWPPRAYAGYPGLYWKMIPLYDRRHIGRIWEQMKRDLYVTSVFNVAARQRQDPQLWDYLEQRFALPFQRMTRYRYYLRLREQLVLQLTRQGKSLDQIAQALMDQGLYPLDRAKREPVRIHDETVRQLHLQAARRVVVRIRRRLREQGLIERGRPGRPKKQKH